MSDHLEPCWHCLCDDKYLIVIEESDSLTPKPQYHVHCDNCFATGPSDYNRDDAIAAWADRPAEAALRTKLEAEEKRGFDNRTGYGQTFSQQKAEIEALKADNKRLRSAAHEMCECYRLTGGGSPEAHKAFMDALRATEDALK